MHLSPAVLSLYLSLIQIFSLAPYFQAPSACVYLLMSETKCHTHAEPITTGKIIVLYILIFMLLESR
jgi:hypothetical protein